ncbi:Leucine-rich repeat [Dillenia turbinata]|uniref:Leucine-rich repeat n=1 Tax=Dillenia turbinata TaxID=194707 RepID=A0AAN8V5P4_9MAGN
MEMKKRFRTAATPVPSNPSPKTSSSLFLTLSPSPTILSPSISPSQIPQTSPLPASPPNPPPLLLHFPPRSHSLPSRRRPHTLLYFISLQIALASIDLSRSRFFTSSGLSYSVTNCSFLVEIDLSNATTLTDSAAAVIAEAKNLERLWLVRCKLISDIGIGCVAVGCRKLRLLSLKWCCRVSDLGVGLIAMKCEDLRSLDLSYLPITEKCLSSILRLQSLEDLVLVACVGLDDDGLRTLKHGCRSLERLDVSNCQSIGHLGLSSFTEGSTCLRLLVLSYGCSVTAVAAKCLQNFSLLQSIKLDGCLVTCCGMKAIGNWCASLVELSLSKCSGVTDVGLCSIVETQKELKKLDITCCRWISYISIDSNTRSCTSLTSLRMESCTQVSKEAFVLIGKCCPFLEELDVTDNEIDDEGLKSISSCSKLCSLKVGICLNVTDQGLISIGMSCSELAELDLYRCLGITDVGVASVAQGCPKLRVINVEYCNKVIDTSLRMLSNCLGLKALEARGCPCISSVGLLAIAEGCRLLTMLDIKNCYNINDSGMVSLACYSQNLKQINLSYCSVTDVGLLALASIRQLQNMTVLHLTGLTPNGLASALLAS